MDNNNNDKEKSYNQKDYSGKARNGRNEWEELSDIIGNEVAQMGEEESFLDEINASLAKQITTELEDNDTSTKVEMDKKPKKKKGLKIFAGVFSVFMILLALLLFTGGGKKLLVNIVGNYIYGNLDYDKDNTTNPSKDNDNGNGIKQPYGEVINILLVGVEEIGGGANTDSIMIATMNTKDKTMKLTSIMRDLYVTIPGYSNNRINAAFAKGGINLLYETIKLNLEVDLDGYAMVNFESFEKIIDLLGGIEITLTQKEANYLRTTNYISDPNNRNVVEGKQLMNGNQVLGYARIRKVSTGTENNDFGRTQRHRAIINAIFEKVKTKNVIQLGLLMNDILNNVKINTDITNKEFNILLEEAISLNVNSLQNMRIPSDGTFDNIKVQMGKYKQDVLQPRDWNATREELRQFIYGPTATPTVVPAQ
jgi:LCP family protein required for cell wall assembly